MALTLPDVWQMETARRAIILAQDSIDRAATPLAGHGACQLNGAPVVLASYDQETGNWTTNPNYFRLPAYLKDRNAKTLWPVSGEWMGHKIDSTEAVRSSALFPAFEADAMTAMIEREAGRRQRVRSHSAELQRRGFRGPQIRSGFGRTARHARRDGSSVEADAECIRSKGWE